MQDATPPICSDTPSSPASDESLYTRARELLTSGDEAGAQAQLIALAEGGSRYWEVYNDLGGMAIAQQDLESALALLVHAVELQFTPGKASVNLALVQSVRQEYEDALATLGPVLRTDPNNADALSLLRQILGEAPTLNVITWARLVADLRTLSAKQRQLLDQAAHFDQLLRDANGKNERLQRQIARLQAELSARRASGDQADWKVINAVSDQKWLDILIDSIEIPSYRGFPLPTFPDDSLQIGTVGSSNTNALREGHNFFLAVKRLATRHGCPLHPDMKLLDFGTGWGRYARMFLKEFPPDNILGVDVDAGFVDICRASFPYGRFETVPAFPPSGLQSAGVDLIVAYSVFSHLSESAANAWIKEFSHLLAPGGIVAITTQGRSFIEFCEDIRQRGDLESAWHQNLARSFIDREDCERRYDAGEFLYSATGGGDVRPSSFYGEALIPRGYVERNWTDELELLEFIDDRGFLPQTLIMLRKRV